MGCIGNPDVKRARSEQLFVRVIKSLHLQIGFRRKSEVLEKGVL